MKNVFVEFIGSGYEVVDMVKVDAISFPDAFAKAEEWYKGNNKTFAYYGMEVKDARFVQF